MTYTHGQFFQGFVAALIGEGVEAQAIYNAVTKVRDHAELGRPLSELGTWGIGPRGEKVPLTPPLAEHMIRAFAQEQSSRLDAARR